MITMPDLGLAHDICGEVKLDDLVPNPFSTSGTREKSNIEVTSSDFLWLKSSSLMFTL